MSKELSFIGSVYFGTGEGMTVAMLVTRAYPKSEDYKTEPSFEDGKFVPGELSTTQDERAVREFSDVFGTWLAHGAEVYVKDEFLERFSRYLPPNVKTAIDNQEVPGKAAGNFKWFSEFHVNYS